MTSSVAPVSIGHRRLLASAGSGKTYQLTTHYIRLLAAGYSPLKILASTFTRGAAGEIRDRILLRLIEAYEQPDKRKALERELGVELLPQRLLALLDHLAKHMHQLQIRTLDSFAASLVRAFSLDLGVTPRFSVMEESDAQAMRQEAIRLLLDERKPERIIKTLRRLTRGQSGRAVTDTIDQLVKDLYDLHREADFHAWDRIHKRSELPPDELQEAIERLRLTSMPAKYTQMQKAHVTSIEHASLHDWRTFLKRGIPNNLLEGKLTFGRQDIPDDVRDLYQPLVAHAAAVIANGIRRRSLAMREIIGEYAAQYEQLKRQHGVQTFSDLTYTLAGLRDDSTRFAHLCYRIDAEIDHVLLDEFQDTNIAQWAYLQPIVTELVSDSTTGKTLFCVGDVKQSIYGWRGAEPDLLRTLPELLFGEGASDAMLPGERLVKSYRSAPPVIEAVNRVFGTIGANKALERDADAACDWQALFSTHETARTDQPGYVVLRTMPKDADDDEGESDAQNQDAVRHSWVAEYVAALHHAHPQQSIGVLTRTNDFAQGVVFELRRLGAAATVRGEGDATDSAAVNLVLDAMRLADHPGDTISAFNIATSPLAPVLHFNDYTSVAARLRVSQKIRRQLSAHGWARTIGEWMRTFAPHCDEAEYRRLLQLVGAAHRFDRAPGERPDDFVRLIEATSVRDAQTSIVEVMTIHQAKGMEFSVVVLPELHQRRSDTSKVVFMRRKLTEPISDICPYESSDVRRVVPEAEPIFEAHRHRETIGKLSLLYVAMTRAEHALHLLIPAPGKSLSSSPAGIVQAALGTGGVEPDAIVCEIGDAQWHQRVKTERSAVSAAARSALQPIDCVAVPKASGRIARGLSAAPASRHASQRFSAAVHLDSAARERGLIMHRFFEQVDWLGESLPSDAQLRAIAECEMPRHDVEWIDEQIASFRSALQQSPLRTLLTRPPDDDPQLHRELPYAVLRDGGVVRGAIDRVVLHHEGGSPIRAHIIDYKTDQPSEKNLPAAAERYREQLGVYRSVVAQQFGIDVSKCAMSLAFVLIGRVVNL